MHLSNVVFIDQYKKRKKNMISKKTILIGKIFIQYIVCSLSPKSLQRVILLKVFDGEPQSI